MPDNQLDVATSPYLLQHKDNPVHWMEWGPAALERSEAERKPILLSIGYAACHWCHVMAHESFEDEATAAVMNALFVCVKVDREERPDVDHIYMNALQAMGEQGGWPLTMFLAADGRAFWGGTYFPKTARYGRPSFTAVLRNVAAAYASNPQQIAQNKQMLMEAALARRHYDEAAPLDRSLLDEAARRAAAAFDPHEGGLDGAPKFPNPTLVEMLIRGGLRLRDDTLLAPALTTLTRMSRGGIYDHLGGGYARYSVDAQWLVPHFEKMLYDNAQLLDLLATAHAITGEPVFRERAVETVGWLAREMTVPEGAFAASLDADSDGVEGRFYVWTAAEVEAVLGAEDAALFGRFYDVAAAGNWHDEETGAPVSILNQLRTPLPDASQALRLAALRQRLLDHRAGRVRPGLDDKVLCDWNGLAIAALARAGVLFEEPGWIAQARRAFAAILAAMRPEVGTARLVHSWRGTRTGTVAFALDYAAMIGAALALHEAVQDNDAAGAQGYLGLAQAWSHELDTNYSLADGALSMTPEGAGDILGRPSPTFDDAVPNPNGVYAAALLRLAALTGESRYRERADRVLEACAGAMRTHPTAHGSLFNALDLRLDGVEVVLAGPSIASLLAAVRRVPALNRTVLVGQGAGSNPVLAAQIGAAGEGAAFLCRGTECSPPVREPQRLLELLGARG